MPFPAGFIEELKARNPIDKIISRYVELKRAGSNLVGLCPFHSERSPSFTVFKDNFHCFGCSAGGDVITFVMRMENLEYLDAIRFLADNCGMTVPENDGGAPRPKSALTREKSFEMNKLAARHFYENLNTPEGAAARAYLIEKRKLTRATCIRFGLGYAKNSFTDLTDFLVSKGFTPEEIKENFLCGFSQKNGRPFDMFRNRVIFPIIDTTGNIIAFGGRVMDDSKPKYLNSSDTVVFKKSRNLFALNFAKNAVLGDKQNTDNGSLQTTSYARPGELIICEGYMDVIAMHQGGFGNAVATLGTAITSEHARLIARYAKVVYLAYDSDAAGQNATERAIRLLAEAGIEAKVIKMTGAKDPDEYIKTFGAPAFAKLLGASEGQIDFKLNGILKKYDLSVPDDKLSAVREACKMLATIRSDVKREVYAKRLSGLVSLSEESINAEIKYAVGAENKRIKARFRDDMQKSLFRYGDTVNLQAAANSKVVIAEQRILGILMMYPELVKDFDITAEDFVTDFNKILFERLIALYQSGETDISALNEFYTPEQFSYILAMKRARSELSANGRDTLKEQLTLLRKYSQKTAPNTEESLSDAISRIRSEKKKGS